MNETNSLLGMASAAARHAALRQSVIAQNIANADTPRYMARDLMPFASYMTDGRRSATATRPGHVIGEMPQHRQVEVDTHAANAATPDGNTVALEDQMVRAADARRQHELALTLFRKSIDLVRTGLGRGR